MGIDSNFGAAFAKAEAAAGVRLPLKGTVFVSVANRDKRSVIFPAKRLADLGFHLAATGGTARVLRQRRGRVRDRAEGVGTGRRGRRNVVQRIADGEIELVFNTPFGRGARSMATSSARPRLKQGSHASPRWRRWQQPCRGSKRLIRGEVSGTVPAELPRDHPMILASGEVLSHKKYGEHFHSLTIVAPEIGARIRPGQFVNVRCGTSRSNILRRPFSVYRVHKQGRLGIDDRDRL